MLIEKEEKGTFLAGPLDVLCILHDLERGTFHAAFLEERPFPGPPRDPMEMDSVRLKSNMHHTGGAPDVEGARAHLEELAIKIEVPPENLWTTPLPWDGEPFSRLFVNWRKYPDGVPKPLNLQIEVG